MSKIYRGYRTPGGSVQVFVVEGEVERTLPLRYGPAPDGVANLANALKGDTTTESGPTMEGSQGSSKGHAEEQGSSAPPAPEPSASTRVPPPAPVRQRRNGYSLDDDLGPLIKGDVALPNFQEVEFVDGIRAIAGHNYLTYAEGRARTKTAEGPYPPSAKYFLTWESMSPSNLDGAGFVLIYDGYANPPRVGRFAICLHSKKLDAGANPRRGWSPGSCVHCGLNMSIDSGD